MPVKISAKKDGFRRCGVAHRAEPTEYPDGRWSEEQLAILMADPDLVVVIIEDESKNGGGEKVVAMRPNAAKAIELVKAAATLESLEQLAQGEDRKSVLAEIDKRRAELSTPASSL